MTTNFWKSNGIVVWGGHPYRINTEHPLMVFDAVSWSKAVQQFYEDASVDAAKESDTLSMERFAAISEQIGQWLRKPSGIVGTVWPLGLRQALNPLRISKDNLHEYMNWILGLSVEAEQNKPYQFVFLADEEFPILFVTKKLRIAAQHTGSEIDGIILCEQEIEKIAEHAIRNPKGAKSAFRASNYQENPVEGIIKIGK